MAEAKKHVKNEKIGNVVANKMAKTIVVEVTRRVPHPVYKRIVTKRKKFYAHDEQGQAKPGDVVRIIECRPMSKLKRWTLGEVLRKAVQVTTDLSAIGIQLGREERVSHKKGKTKKGKR
ncbi:MAG TPA: 30S ribosomal protein S17 [Bryobacteraceae bacterium]|jgi:small subunit ribosomal protein S17|nr:30S ribosomal protein S17 [Bryobacteraceae bacterium]